MDENSQRNAVIQLIVKRKMVRRHPSSNRAEKRNAARKIKTYGRSRIVLRRSVRMFINTAIAVTRSATQKSGHSILQFPCASPHA